MLMAKTTHTCRVVPAGQNVVLVQEPVYSSTYCIVLVVARSGREQDNEERYEYQVPGTSTSSIGLFQATLGTTGYRYAIFVL
jgi:hypothetical protein